MKSEKQPEVVVITGGTAGLGRAIVRKFAIAGAHVGIIARDCDRLQQTKSEVEAIGGRAVTVSADVSGAQSVENAAAEIEGALGPIDIWINNAMVSVFSPFRELTAEEFKRVTDVTYLGYVYGTMAALRRMLPRDRGTVVQVGSALAYRSIPLQAAYCGAKHAIRGFTDTVRTELMHDNSNVHVTMVQMPGMNTPQFDWVKSRLRHRAQPVPPFYQPEVGADAVFWAAHRKRREVYVGAPTVGAIWGQKIAPLLLARYLARTNYQAQQTDQLEDPERPDNLYEAVPGDYEAHGRFDDRARASSVELWLAKNKYRVGLGVAAGMAGLAGGIAAGQRLLKRGPEKSVRRSEEKAA